MNEEIVDIYQGEAFVLSNFSLHEVIFKWEVYKTAEHCYHCQRYDNEKIIHEIKNSISPDEAWQLSQKYKSFQISDFDNRKVLLMKEILLAKVLQYPSIGGFLMSTWSKSIEKCLSADNFWWTWIDWNGKNMLGKLWMEIREEMKLKFKNI